jgi:hypothetical protein
MSTQAMATQQAASHNPAVRSSGKVGKNSASRIPRRALVLAADLARQIGMVPSWPNVEIIRMAIESEADYSGVTIGQAAALILQAANDFTSVDPQHYSFQAAALLRKSNIVNRFWFEDALWREKYAYLNMLARLKAGTQ